MAFVRLRAARLLLALTLIFSIGGHWFVLQSVAWFGMAVKYSQSTSVSEALSRTFDGRHPCKLCQFVKDGKAAEKKSDSKLETKKLDLVSSTVTVFHFPPRQQFSTLAEISVEGWTDAPPTPPPSRA